MTDPGRSLRVAAFTAVVVGAVGSLAFLFLDGNGRRQIVLMILFVGWVLLPYVGLAVADRFARNWPSAARATLYVVALIVTACSLAVYSGLIPPPADARPAFLWLMVPLGSMVLIAGVFIVAPVARRRS
jgi:hypothetical protein